MDCTSRGRPRSCNENSAALPACAVALMLPDTTANVVGLAVTSNATLTAGAMPPALASAGTTRRTGLLARVWSRMPAV
mgnify:CR=1 FL=1